MLNYGRHLGFTEKVRNSRSRWLFANSSWGNAAMAFHYRRSFMYTAVSDISYIAESVASLEKESGSVAKPWTSNIQFVHCTILTVM